MHLFEPAAGGLQVHKQTAVELPNQDQDFEEGEPEQATVSGHGLQLDGLHTKLLGTVSVAAAWEVSGI